MKGKFIRVLIATVLVLSFSLVTAAPVGAATTYYVTTGGNNSNIGSSGSPWLTIQYAIDTAAGGDTINVAAGTYLEDLTIPDTKTGLELVGVGATAIIKGVQTTAIGLLPLAEPNIDILADGVKLHDFTIEGPAPATGFYSSGLIIGAGGVEIYDNAFKVTNSGAADELSQGIQTWHVVALPGVDISGLNIHDNTFTSLGTGTLGYEGIYINLDTEAAGTVTIADNVFTGDVRRAIATERDDTTISGNSAITGLPVGDTWSGISVSDAAGSAQDAVTVTGNTLKGSSSGKGFREGIRIGVGSQTLTAISVTKNTIQMNTVGIKVRSSASGVTVKYNDISGNTNYGIENTNSGTPLVALYNYWGTGLDGPAITTNPNGTGNAVTTDVTYRPWLYYTAAANNGDTVANIVTNQVPAYVESVDLTAGWNIFSVPIGLDGQYNTWAELYTLTSLDYSMAYRFNPVTQTFVSLGTTDTYALAPGEGLYIKMTSADSIPYAYSTVLTIPGRDLSAGWNLVGGGMTTQDEIITLVSIATVGSTAGYTQVISPAENAAESWVWYTGVDGSQGDLVLGEGYWVFLPIDRTLGLFDLTPVTWVP